MTAANREPGIKQTLRFEGGYTNNPKDPGGPTNWGITIHDARTYWKPDATAEDVRAMPLIVAIEIYRKRYWAIGRISCDDEPAGVDFSKFDYRVNSGAGRADPDLERCRRPSAVDTVKAYCAARLNFLHHLRTWSVFGSGWGSRVAQVEAVGVKMALEAEGHSPDVVRKKLDDESAKAAKRSVGHVVPPATTGGSVAIPGAPDVSSWDLSTKIGIAVVAIPLVLFCAWWAWHHFQRARAYANVSA